METDTDQEKIEFDVIRPANCQGWNHAKAVIQIGDVQFETRYGTESKEQAYRINKLLQDFVQQVRAQLER